MNKQDFLEKLREGLSGLPESDLEERLNFYGEMIDDRVEEGFSEDEAVKDVGSVDEITSQILSETPLSKLVKEKIKQRRRLSAWEIVLLVLGAPIWLSLMIALFSIVISIYAAIWSVVVALWSVEVAVIGCALGGILSAGVFAYQGNGIICVAVLGAGIICAGLSILVFFGCRAVTKGILILTKKIVLLIKNCFVKRGNRDE